MNQQKNAYIKEYDDQYQLNTPKLNLLGSNNVGLKSSSSVTNMRHRVTNNENTYENSMRPSSSVLNIREKIKITPGDQGDRLNRSIDNS